MSSMCFFSYTSKILSPFFFLLCPDLMMKRNLEYVWVSMGSIWIEKEKKKLININGFSRSNNSLFETKTMIVCWLNNDVQMLFLIIKSKTRKLSFYHFYLYYWVELDGSVDIYMILTRLKRKLILTFVTNRDRT